MPAAQVAFWNRDEILIHEMCSSRPDAALCGIGMAEVQGRTTGPGQRVPASPAHEKENAAYRLCQGRVTSFSQRRWFELS